MVTIESNIIIATVLIFGVLILCLIGMLATYMFIIRKNASKKEAGDEVTRVSTEKLMSEVSARSVKVLEEAHRSAREILSNAEGFMKRNEDVTREEMEKVAKEYLLKYENSLNEIKLEAIKTIHNIPKDVSESVDGTLDVLEKTTETEIKKIHTRLNESLNKALADTDSEISKYQKERIKKIDESSLVLARNIAKKVLSRDISPEEHEKMVVKALEEAKRQGIFN